MSAQVLNDLEARAGASDKDIELWKAQRALGVTATNIRDVMIAGNRDQAIRDLVDKKRNGDPFKGNAYTAWGNEREPIILADLEGYGVVAEHRVFHAEQNSRYLASPDGLNVDPFIFELELEEVKTCGYPLPKGSDALALKGYEWQMQWQMFVCGAVGCWLTVEVREGKPGNFRAGERSREYFPRDEEMIAAMIPVADRILALMDDPDAAPVIDEAVDTHAVNYLRAADEEKRWKALKEQEYRAVVESGVSQVSELARVTFTPATVGEVAEVVEFDEDAARQSRQDVWAKVFAARQKLAAVEAQWAEVLEGHKTVTQVHGKGRPAGARISPVKQKGMAA